MPMGLTASPVIWHSDIKCQLFRTELQYTGNTILIKDKRVCMKSLTTMLQAKQKLKPLKKGKDCKSFPGFV